MKRLLSLAMFTTLATMIGSANLSAQPQVKPANLHDKHFDDCANICAECQIVCEKNFHHCSQLVESGKKEHAKAMILSLDCAEFCTLSAKLTARHSPLAAPSCETCAKACDACAAECEKFPDQPEMKACAETCKKCAASCREMVKMVGAHH